MELTKFDQKTHVYGRIWTVLALLVILSVPTAISIHLQAFPPIKVVLAGLAPVLMLYVPTGFVEVALYVPMIGPGATYLAFVTGNINNLKMPCSIATLSTNKVSIQSEEGEVLSTLAVGASSIVTMFIIAVFVLLFTPVLPYITAVESPFAPAFTQVVPALFGALMVPYLRDQWKLFPIPLLLLCLLLLFFGRIQIGVLIFIGVALALLSTHLLYKTGVVEAA